MTRMPCLVLGALLAASPPLVAQDVTEILGFLGDGTTPLGVAQDVAVDDAGTVYVSAWLPSAVFQVTSSGDISVIVDASGDGAGQPLDDGFGVDVDAAGNVYVLGRLSQNVLRVTPSGQVTAILTSVGDGAGHPASGPRSLAVAPDGTAYVACLGSRNVFRVSPAGVVQEILAWDQQGVGPQFQGSINKSIALDAQQSVYVGSLGGEVFKVDVDDSVSIPIGPADGLEDPGGLAIDDSGHLWVAETGFIDDVDQVFRVSPGGGIEMMFDETQVALPGDGIDNLYAMAAGSGGRVYAAGFDTNSVIELFANGGVSLVFPVFGQGGFTGSLSDALAVGPDGALYLPRANSVVRLEPPSGWDDPGLGLAGTLGVPRLSGSGTIATGQTLTFAVRDVAPGSVGALVLGLSAINAPFKGGTFVPDPLFLLTGLLVDEQVEVLLQGPWPAVPVGTTLHAQFWVPDAAGPFGFAASNAVSATKL